MAIELLAAASTGAIGQVFAKGQTISLSPSGGQVQATAANAKLEARFKDAIANADMNSASNAPSPVIKSMFGTLDQVNGQARSVSEYAAKAEADGGSLTPGEIVQLTMRCNEFMFQCQLTSNIANRSSDGVQQLFRQQG